MGAERVNREERVVGVVWRKGCELFSYIKRILYRNTFAFAPIGLNLKFESLSCNISLMGKRPPKKTATKQEEDNLNEEEED